ncbi:helix-turn-helix domain-containing protein [Paraliobacillus salinarum]|uniref:helix-turn-helix domain-containing protein n=1 Tax=Paraliobacillus salinarum TaxID=1158996 RepID=UPI0015F6FEBB|nr:helix-turn-helix domain-containing protein [Paraliobacillus salinarum]
MSIKNVVRLNKVGDSLLFQYIILECLRKIKQERTTASVYHLLKGKRSSQTIQDAHVYRIGDYFGILKKLNRSTFENAIDDLIKNNYILMKNSNIAILTEKGIAHLNNNQEKYGTHYFNGMEYSNEVDIFYLRLQLAIQTYSNLANNCHQFVPLTDDRMIQKFLKEHYKQYKSNVSIWLHDVYLELFDFLEAIPMTQAQLFVDRLSGFNKIGLSFNQLAVKNKLTVTDVSLNLTSILHRLYTDVNKDNNHTRQLKQFLYDQPDTLLITQSANKTLEWLVKGFSIEQIANIRKLKTSTIEDHIIEMAYADSAFDLARFIDANTYHVIKTAFRQMQTTKLKEIREALNNQYNYFQIRLVLAYESNQKRG